MRIFSVTTLDYMHLLQIMMIIKDHSRGQRIFDQQVQKNVFFETNFQRIQVLRLKEELEPLITIHHQEALAGSNY